MPTIATQDQIFPNIEAIIFDKDGTLADSQSVWRKIGQARSRLIDAQVPGVGEPLLMAFGIQDNFLDPTGLMAVGNRYENEIAAAAYIAETGRSWFEAKEIARHAFTEADRGLAELTISAPLFPGSLELLQSLASAGIKLGILSADSTANVEAFVNKHQLSSYIQLSMGSDRGLTKPDPALFLAACHQLGVRASATLMVGDSQTDLDMAKRGDAAGAIGICWENRQISHLPSADVAIAQLNQIKLLVS
jgi:phosphoglycolate phosphatase